MVGTLVANEQNQCFDQLPYKLCLHYETHKYLNAEGWNNSSKESLFLWTCLHHSSFNKIQTDSAYIKNI